MRSVLLTPEHSSWWLLSPGVTLYYDEVCILEADYRELLDQGGQSSYHEQVARNVEALVEQGQDPVIRIESDERFDVDRDVEQQRRRAEVWREAVYAIASNPDDPTLDAVSLVELIEGAFRHWIAHNERKLDFLLDTEDYRRLLERDLLPGWRERLRTIHALKAAPLTEIVDRIRDDEQVESTLSRLLAAAARCIDLVDGGHRIFDPMLVEYMPTIALLESIRTTNALSGRVHDASLLFEAYRIRMERYGSVEPLDIALKDLPQHVRRSADLRERLERVDRALESVDEDDPAAAFAAAKAEVEPLVREARRSAAVVEHGIWMASMLSPLVGAAAAPRVTTAASRVAGALPLIVRNVGRFAGSYAVVAEHLAVEQRTRKRAASGEFDEAYFERHYWDFGDNGNRA